MRKTFLIVMVTIFASMAFFQHAFGASKARSAISPYIQTDPNSTYTFVGITHPSLNTAATKIGLSIATVGLDGATPSTQFTISAGETYRIFIVSTNHSTINSLSVTGARVVFLATTTGGSASGQLLLTSNTVDPTAQSRFSVLPGTVQGPKLEGLNQLSMWGAIVIPSTSTGFAMEFIGDAHDSAVILESSTAAMDIYTQGNVILGKGRGVK
jgi:hypothetical protein